MASDLIIPAERARGGWASRLSQFFGAKSKPAPEAATRLPRSYYDATSRKIHGIAHHLIADDRYVFVLLREAADDIDDRDARAAWRVLEEQMAMIPGGAVETTSSHGIIEAAELPGFYLDRYSVTNHQFQRFVAAGAYDDLEIWPQEVWPSLMRFVDRSSQPGPRDWERGKYPPGKGDHPVVGICWFEALAYARWVGKRLPTAIEWQKAGGWPQDLSGGGCNRYPWGDIFEPKRANLWPTGLGRTVPVGEFAPGATPNGIYQLTGNVWEWLDDALEAIPCRPDESFQVWKPLRRIAGGAFNTYFPAEATCQFVTGQPELDRCDNIGFRCALSADRLR
jgi:iron(II)-dependent oxidoreductase